MTSAKGLVVVHHSRGGSTAVLAEAAVEGATEATSSTTVPVVVFARSAFDAGVDDVLRADALLLATPAHFGYMAGAVKDFFERIYYACLERSTGLPYGLIVKGDTDVDGALSSVTKIATGLGWHLVLPPVTVVGAVTDDDRARAHELGATLAAGLGEAMF